MILSGKAKINIDDKVREIRKGDCVLTRDGSSHGIADVTETLRFIAVEVNKCERPKPFVFEDKNNE